MSSSSPVQQQGSGDADRQSSPPSLGAPASRVPPLTLGAADDTAGTPRIAPPERIPSRRFLSNGSFHHSPTGVAPAVPSSRPGTPRVTPAGSRSAFGESDGAQLTVQRNGGMSGSFAAPTNRPAPPRSRPPVESSPAQSPLFATSVTTSPRGGPQSVVSEPPQQQLPQQQSTALPAPFVSSSAANNGNRSQSQSHGRAASTDNSSFATFDPSSSAHAATKAATATSGNTAVDEPQQQQQQSKATPSPSTYTQPQQRSVSEAEAAEDEDDAYAPSKVVVDPKKAHRSGYADALASASLFFGSGDSSSNAQNADAEEAAREVRRARRQQLDRERDEAMQRQQQIRRRNSAAADTDAAGVFFTNSAGSGGSVKSATTVHSNNAVGGYDAARASLTSPSRDFFGPLNTIDRRKLHEPVVCEKLFSYEEPASYSATNRDALAVPPRPSANSNANGYSNSGVRRRGAGPDGSSSADYYPAPVGMTLYEFRRDGSNAAGDGISNPIGGGFVGGAEEPYEGRNELVRQLREYELRQAHQEDLRRPSASTAGHGQYSNYAAVESHYRNNGYGSSSSQARAGSAHPSAAAAADGYNNPNNNSTYFDVMYGEARQQQQQQQQMDHNNASGAAVMRGHSAAPINQSHHHHNYSTAATNRSLHRPPGAPIPSYGSTYADYAQGGEKIVRSFPSEWRVGPFPSGAPRGGSAAPFNNNNGGGSGNLNRSQSQAMPLQQTPLAFRGPSQTSTLSRQQSVDRYGPRGSGDGAIAHRTPF